MTRDDYHDNGNNICLSPEWSVLCSFIVVCDLLGRRSKRQDLFSELEELGDLGSKYLLVVFRVMFNDLEGTPPAKSRQILGNAYTLI
ncbi:unnamed protein product [Dovyalis caffra]|uniref:Uncharacterized protein n=1 Tax=Dovyalis caffra TaxID=77055 RepID=A0AAV1SNV2_9ROSI|nr:unnamed protein product [Dovyalis caffra]